MRSTWPAALLALALLTGCGSSTDGSPQAGPPAPGPATTKATGKSSDGPQCPANSAVGSALGITVTGTQEPTRSGTTSVVCSYDGTKAGDKLVSVTLRLETGTSSSDFVDFRTKTTAQGYPTSDRSGVGDEAFTYVVSSRADPVNGLVARKGDLLVYVATQVSFDQLIALANQLFAA